MKIKGLITAMVTPLDEKGVNEAATRRLVNRLIAEGVSGLFILGTNGEFYALSREEKEKLAALVVEEVHGRVPVFAGSGGISTAQVINLSKRFAELGVDAVSVITPFLMKLTDRELINHYKEIARAVSLPIILYNMPANTGNNISAAVYQELLKIPSIIAIKDSSGDLQQLETYIKNNHRDDFAVLVGSDSKILAGLQLGADGAVATTSNVLTRTDVGIYESFRKNDLKTARQLQNSIEDLRSLLKLSTVPSVLKYSMDIIGYQAGSPKLPILPVPKEFHDEIKKILTAYKTVEKFEFVKGVKDDKISSIKSHS